MPGWSKPYPHCLPGAESIQYPLGLVDGFATGDVGQGIQGCAELWEKRAGVGLAQVTGKQLAGQMGIGGRRSLDSEE